jgi:uncharacterized protein YdaT
MEENNELETQETVVENNGATIGSDGTIKLDLSQINKPKTDAIQEQETNEVDVRERTGDSEEVDEEVPQQQEPFQNEGSVIEEIIDEQLPEEATQEAVTLQEEVREAVAESRSQGIDLPENIQKVVDFMNETGGSLEDYVKLNTDYSKLDNYNLLKEYYQNTKPHLDNEEIDFLMEENFAFDEDVDDEREIRKKKIAQKEELQKARKHLEGLKSQYYSEIKSGTKLAPEQQKAIEFFNRYNKENEEAIRVAEEQAKTFLQKTDQVFSNDFKGFDFNVGDKKYRFNVKNASDVKNTQSDINNFIKKFLNEKNEMSDAKGYHKGLFTAMNADAVAQHFYEQGKADAMKDSTARAKNIEMGVRGVHQDVKQVNGWQVRAVETGRADSKLKIKTFKPI